MTVTSSPTLEIKQLRQEDVEEAARIVPLAFGTFLGLPDPMEGYGDRDVFSNRWRANPHGVLGAYLDGRVVGSNVVSRWGSFGWFGPLTIRPDLWDKGIARKLMDETMALFSKWGPTHEALFTFSHSPKHLGLYQKYGFHARFLTPIMKKGIGRASQRESATWVPFSSIESKGKNDVLKELQELTDRLLPRLDLSSEVKAVDSMKLGETILLQEGSSRSVAAFAVCHAGSGTEGGTGNCYVKFAAALSGSNARARFRDLLSAVEDYARRNSLATIEAGVNVARRGAYAEMLASGFRTEFIGVAMQKPDEPAYNRADVFALDDLR
jgi:GNAT superfamily N-acetyltransferase